jgi:uncharacterized protein YqeY
MALSLKERIQEDMKSALRNKDSTRLGTIRMIMAAIKQREVDERTTLADPQVIEVLDKMQKQRRESISQYEKAQRQDLVDKEVFEISVIQEYLPPALDDAELEALIKEAITVSGAASPKDMGKVIGLLKPRIQGRADMGKVSGKIKEKLSAL